MMRVTFKQRADLPPAGDASLAGELAQRRLQEEHGDPAGEEEDQVGDEERPWRGDTQQATFRLIFTRSGSVAGTEVCFSD